MSKQQAILETLLGAAELSANSTLVERVRLGLNQFDDRRRYDGYRRLNAAAEGVKRVVRKAA